MSKLKFTVGDIDTIPEAHRGFYAKIDGKWRLQAEGLDEELKRRDDALVSMRKSFDDKLIDDAFSRSSFVAEKLTLPHDLIRSRFGSSFKVEAGELVAYDGSSNKIYSRKKPGQLADFDEALGLIIDAYPNKAEIIKGKEQARTPAAHSRKASEVNTAQPSLVGSRAERRAAIAARFPNLPR